MPANRRSGKVVVILDPVKLAELLRSPRGPVVRRLIEDGELVKAEAKRRVGVYRPPDAYSGANRKRRPGTLRDSIVKRVVSRGGEVAVEVGSEDPVSLWHHEGTRRHTIPARRKPFLVFFWPRVGHVVRLRRVNHPGTRPNRFLTDALRVLRSRY